MAESRRDEIAKLEALYASNPEGRVFTHLAEAYRRAGELDRAREILDRGLQRHPDYPSAHVVLGRVLADQGRDEEAAGAFQRVLELDSENLIARRSLAEAARAAGRDEEALGHYRVLLANDPGAQEIHETVADLEARLHGPAARPAAPPAEWGMVQAQESWEPAGPAAPAFGEIDFGEAAPQAEPVTPAMSDVPVEATPLDLSAIDFGFGPAPDQAAEPPAAEAAPESVEAEPDTVAASAEAPEAAAEAEAEAEAEARPGLVEPAPQPESQSGLVEPAPQAEAPRPLEATPLETTHPPAGFEEATEPAPAPAAAHPPAPAEGPTVHPGAREQPPEPYGVATETLATLYQAQGFPDRAAAIYRVLVRERPHDEGLQARARAAEEAAAAMRAQRTGIEETREVWVSGDDAGAQPLPAHAWGGDVDEDEPLAEPAGPTIAEYLQRVLAWRPSEPVAPPPSAGAPGVIAATASQPSAPAARAPRAPGTETPVPFAFQEPEEPVGPWESDAATDELDTLDGFVFTGEPEEPQAEAPIEFGYGLGPGEEAYGAEQRGGAAEAIEPPAGASIGFGAPAPDAGAEPPEGLEPVGTDLHLDTLLPLPREGAEAEEPTTWFEPERAEPAPRAPLPFQLEPDAGPGEPGTGPEEPAAEPLPFEYEPAAEDEGAGEPLHFALESIGTEEEAAAESLPFEMESIGGEGEELAGEPLPFELEALGAEVDDHAGGPPAEAEPPFAITPDDALAGDEGVLELEEEEAVTEPPAATAPWDPTVALADVDVQPRRRPEAKLRYEPPARPAPPPPRAAATEDVDEDEDLEMFRAWLQSLKR